MRRVWIAALSVAAFCAGAGVGAQTEVPAGAQQVRTASISGQVIDGDTGEAVGGAFVRLTMRNAAANPANGRGNAFVAPTLAAPPSSPGNDYVMTDADGRFVFHDLPKGPAQLVATMGGYVERPGQATRPQQLTDGQHLSDVKLRLVKTASISGIIVDEAGEPLVGAQVRAMRRDMPMGTARYVVSDTAHTDDRGMYRLDGLTPGQFVVVFPQTQTTVPVATVEKSSEGLGGMLGASNPFVEALTGGMSAMVGSAGVRVGDQMWQTGDAGPLSIGGSSPSPPPINGRVSAYQTTFYPGVAQLSLATPVLVKSGEARNGVDWQVRPTGVARVAGVVVGDGPASGVVISLVPAPGSATDTMLPVARATTSADGSFTFLGVPSGQYVARGQQQARSGLGALTGDMMAGLPPEIQSMMQGRLGGSGDASFVNASVSVGDKDVVGLALTLRPGAKVSGRVVFDGATPPTPQQLQAAQVSLVATGGAANAFGGQMPKLAADGSFKTGSYGAGTYTLNITGIPGAWLMKSVLIGGREAASSGFELHETDMSDAVVTFTDRIPSITGSVKVDGTAPMPSATVIMIPSDYRAWLANGAAARGQVTALVQTDGAFTLARVLPGDYLVTAVVDDVLSVDHDAAFYDALARLATRVTVGDGEKKTMELRLVRSLR